MRVLRIDTTTRQVFVDNEKLAVSWTESAQSSPLTPDSVYELATTVIDDIENEIGPLTIEEIAYVVDTFDKLSFEGQH
jgi:hypothetical protein